MAELFPFERHQIEEFAEHSIAIRKFVELFPDVIQIRDATEELLLNITDADVDEAQPGNPANCAVAVNLRRQGIRGLIGRGTAILAIGQDAVRYHLGKDAQVKTAFFDSRGTMETGPILLSPVPPSMRLGRIQSRTNQHTAKEKEKGRSRTSAVRQTIRREAQHSITTRGFRTWDRTSLPVA